MAAIFAFPIVLLGFCQAGIDHDALNLCRAMLVSRDSKTHGFIEWRRSTYKLRNGEMHESEGTERVWYDGANRKYVREESSLQPKGNVNLRYLIAGGQTQDELVANGLAYVKLVRAETVFDGEKIIHSRNGEGVSYQDPNTSTHPWGADPRTIGLIGSAGELMTTFDCLQLENAASIEKRSVETIDGVKLWRIELSHQFGNELSKRTIWIESHSPYRIFRFANSDESLVIDSRYSDEFGVFPSLVRKTQTRNNKTVLVEELQIVNADFGSRPDTEMWTTKRMQLKERAPVVDRRSDLLIGYVSNGEVIELVQGNDSTSSVAPSPVSWSLVFSGFFFLLVSWGLTRLRKGQCQ